MKAPRKGGDEVKLDALASGDESRLDKKPLNFRKKGPKKRVFEVVFTRNFAYLWPFSVVFGRELRSLEGLTPDLAVRAENGGRMADRRGALRLLNTQK